MKKNILLIIVMILFGTLATQAQEGGLNTKEMTKKELMKLNYDQLLEMPFGELKRMAELIGVSTDELLKMALNREVSSASKKGESVFESPLSTTVISKEEIELTGATTYEELFRSVPGMIIREESNGNFDIHIRGNDNLPPGNFSHFSENTMTLVMIDGRIVYNYINGGTIWESIPVSLSDIERIEIIRGASTALYGPNAVSGVINIITRNPNQIGEYLHGSIQVGNNNSYVGNISFLNRTNDKFAFKLSGAYDHRDRSQTDFYQYLTGTYVPADSIRSMFAELFEASSPNANLSKRVHSANAGLFYDPTPEISMELNGGWQSSESQSMFLENLTTPFGIRDSKTGYIDYKASGYGLQAQVNFLGGRQNLHQKMVSQVVEYDMNILNAVLEYNWLLNDLGIGELSLRPGFNYQNVNYDDEKYVRKIDTTGVLYKGLLNGKKSLETISGSVRLDWKPMSSLRVIAAIRADKYNVLNDMYLSWQTVAAYNLNSKHLIRGTYSRANRGSFLGTAYASYKNELNAGTLVGFDPIGGRPEFLNYNQYYSGGKELNLLTQNLFEVGYRGILTDYLQVDVEGFYSITSDFDALLPSSYTITPDTTPAAITTTIDDEWSYQNIDMKSKQMGVTVNLTVQPMNKLLVKFFGTYQKTTLTHVLKNISSLYVYGMSGLPIGGIAYKDLPDDAFENRENEWTPAFYGGMMVNYVPVSKLNINASAYFYDKQVYSRYFYHAATMQHGTIEAKQKANIILSAKIAYRVNESTSIYVNARNLTDHGLTEIPYNDKIRGLYLVGVNFNF